MPYEKTHLKAFTKLNFILGFFDAIATIRTSLLSPPDRIYQLCDNDFIFQALRQICLATLVTQK